MLIKLKISVPRKRVGEDAKERRDHVSFCMTQDVIGPSGDIVDFS